MCYFNSALSVWPKWLLLPIVLLTTSLTYLYTDNTTFPIVLLSFLFGNQEFIFFRKEDQYFLKTLSKTVLLSFFSCCLTSVSTTSLQELPLYLTLVMEDPSLVLRTNLFGRELRQPEVGTSGLPRNIYLYVWMCGTRLGFLQKINKNPLRYYKKNTKFPIPAISRNDWPY